MAQPRRYLIPRCAAFLLFVCTGLPGLPVAAAESSVPAKGPVFTVLATGARPLPEGLHYLESPDEGVALKTSFARRTGPLGVTAAGGTLIFGIPRPNPAEGESRFVALGSVPWPAGVTERALVLLATTEGGRLSGVAIDDGESLFPHGTLRIVNLVKRPLAARWGDTTWEVSPGPGAARPYPVVAAGGASQASRFKVMLGTLREDGAGSTLIYAGRAEARPGARTLVVVREVKETEVMDEGEIVNAGVSYNVRWVVDSLPRIDKAAP